MIARESQIKQLDKIEKRNKSSFLAITGRRRVGKKYIVDTYFEKKFVLDLQEYKM